MNDLHELEKDTYEQMWALDSYAEFSPGEKYLPIFLDMLAARSLPREIVYATGYKRQPTVLDAGIGSGKGAVALRNAGFDVTGCDIVDPTLLPEQAKQFPVFQSALWLNLQTSRHDYVYCCDVMEHIPPQFTMLVVHQLLRVARHGVFFSISTVPDMSGAFIGKPLHLTVQPYVWWRDSLALVGTVLESRDLLNAVCFFVGHR